MKAAAKCHYDYIARPSNSVYIVQIIRSSNGIYIIELCKVSLFKTRRVTLGLLGFLPPNESGCSLLRPAACCLDNATYRGSLPPVGTHTSKPNVRVIPLTIIRALGKVEKRSRS